MFYAALVLQTHFRFRSPELLELVFFVIFSYEKNSFERRKAFSNEVPVSLKQKYKSAVVHIAII